MPHRPTFEISVYLTNRAVLLVGDGPVADDRERRLRAAQAGLTRVSGSDYRAELCAGKFLVVAADTDHALNERVARDAAAAGCLRYAHDRPACSDFAMPALIERGPLRLAITTQGVAPALARVMRERLEALLATGGPALDRLITALAALRPQLAADQRAAQLYQLASRLRISGTLSVDDEAFGRRHALEKPMKNPSARVVPEPEAEKMTDED